MGRVMSGLESYSCLCLDSSPFIYFIEEDVRYIDKVTKMFSAISDGDIKAVSSYLSLLEVLVKPIENGVQEIAARYKDFMLSSDFLRLFPLDDVVAEQAAWLRAKYHGNGFKLRTPDAIQIATGIVNGADVFITNDSKLKQVKEIKVVVLDELVS